MNWFTASDGPAELMWWPSSYRGSPPSITEWKCQQSSFTNEKAGSEPLIVAPALEKTSSQSAIQAQWRSAIRNIKKARAIVIVGYSFPETDAFMSRLLAEGIRDTTGPDRIYIINSDTRESWWERVASAFSVSWWKMGVHAFEGDFATFSSIMCDYFAHYGPQLGGLADAQFGGLANALRHGRVINGEIVSLKERFRG
ncbi:MAG: hypothetical protein HS101_14030 [Planctomycetia bacterium]|nr:hypothetical protein [Planctomycetia bacterium]MCC7314654.1 hypothetical protein [Planctomycetota bacterium]